MVIEPAGFSTTFQFQRQEPFSDSPGINSLNHDRVDTATMTEWNSRGPAHMDEGKGEASSH